ncbi:MAG: tetratricopeptide repeat protein [Planctomycetota bacterium]
MIAVFYFLSGATALLYQLAWTRRLVLAVGNTHLSVTALLFSFMLGLGLGAIWAGRHLRRGQDARALYAGAELALAGLAALFPIGASALESGLATLPGAWGSGAWLRFAAAALLLLPPCFCMGITFPAVCVLGVRKREHAGKTIAWLNGVNIAGAASGAALTGFWLIPELGIRATVWGAAGVNALLGLCAWKLLRSAREGEPLRGRSEEAPSSAPLVGWMVVLLSSAVVLGLEVLWTRMLVFYLKGFTYTFTAILVVFLVGLSLGSLLIAPWLGRWIRGQSAFGWAALASAAAVAWSVDGLVHGGDRLETLFRELRAAGESGQARYLFEATVRTLGVPVVLLGSLFPLALNAWLGTGPVGQGGARLFFASCLGSALGSCLAGLVIVPTLGMVRGVWLMVFLLAGLGALASLVLARGAMRRLAGAAVLIGASVIIVPRLDWSPAPFVTGTPVLSDRQGRFELLDYREGTACAVSVLEDRATGRRLLYTDEFMAAATGEGYRYMRLQGHLPVLLAEDPRRALLICFGTGTTAGSLLVHDRLERLDVVEISKEVLEVAPYFEKANRGVLSGLAPFDVRAHVQDGRQFLLASNARFDVITLEPLLPFTPAAVHFYTREFYELCRARLTDGGVLCHWIPIHAIEPEAYRTLLRTFTEVFPDGGVWLFENSSLLIGTLQPLALDPERLTERMKPSGVSEDLRRALTPTVSQVLGGFVTDNRTLKKELEGASVMSDDLTSVEYGMWWPGRESYGYHADNAALLAKVAEAASLPMIGVASEEAKGSRQARLWCLEAAGLRAARYAGRPAKDPGPVLERAVKAAPSDPWPLHALEEHRFEELYTLGVARSKIDPAGAADLLGRALMLKPDHPEARLWLAEVQRSRGDERNARKILAAGQQRFEAWVEWSSTQKFLREHEALAAIFEDPSEPSEERKAPTTLPEWLEAWSRGEVTLVDLPPDGEAGLIAILGNNEGDLDDRRLALFALRESAAAGGLPSILALEPDLEGQSLEVAWRIIGQVDAERLKVILDSALAGDSLERKNRAVSLIGSLSIRSYVPKLIDLLESEDEATRTAAIVALFQITEQQLDYDFQSPADERRAAADRWRDWWRENAEPDPSDGENDEDRGGK